MNSNTPLILIAEDSPTQAIRLEVILTGGGYHVVTARDGRDALKQLETVKPDLIITDVIMPNVDGYELCRVIKADDRLSGIPVVFLTSQRDPESVIRAIECGGDSFISKPYESDFLLTRVQALLSGPSVDISSFADAVNSAGRPTDPEERDYDAQVLDSLKNFVNKERELGLAIIAIKKTLGRLSSANQVLEVKNREMEKEIVRRKELEVSLVAAKEAAEVANRAKSVFLAKMSHELRTPLNAILGYTQLLSHDANLTPAQRDHLRIVFKSGDHLLGLINDILELAKVESHKVTLEPKDIDLVSFLNDLIIMLRVKAEAKGLRLALDQASSFPRFARADASKLRQILLNVVGNAIKFTAKGEVRVKLGLIGSNPAPGKIELVFEVTDTGPGIAPEDLERIFRPFEQAKNRPEVEGTGLGLSITREYLALMGGDIRVTSRVGEGSVFRFSIVADAVDAAGAERLACAHPSAIVAIEGAQDCPVLVVEDHPENRVLVRKLLELWKFPVREAADGAEALRIAAEWRPRLVLLDRKMPVLDGVATAAALRKAAGLDPLRIIAVSAEAFPEEQREMLDAGCDDFLKKPYLDDELYEIIGKHLPVKLVRAEAGVFVPTAESAAGEAACLELASRIPAAELPALRAAAAAADLDTFVDFLRRYPEFTPCLRGDLDTYRFDHLAYLLAERPSSAA